MGTTKPVSSLRDVFTVHPHARGDDSRSSKAGKSRVGSPPRPWGRRASTLIGRFPVRFTPTPVGTTEITIVFQLLQSVHPHARGDDGINFALLIFAVGSPPRPWGRRILLMRMFPWFTVHPHARGDDVVVMYPP